MQLSLPAAISSPLHSSAMEVHVFAHSSGEKPILTHHACYLHELPIMIK
jgi:hypothetical protein